MKVPIKTLEDNKLYRLQTVIYGSAVFNVFRGDFIKKMVPSLGFSQGAIVDVEEYPSLTEREIIYLKGTND